MGIKVLKKVVNSLCNKGEKIIIKALKKFPCSPQIHVTPSTVGFFFFPTRQPNCNFKWTCHLFHIYSIPDRPLFLLICSLHLVMSCVPYFEMIFVPIVQCTLFFFILSTAYNAVFYENWKRLNNFDLFLDCHSVLQTINS